MSVRGLRSASGCPVDKTVFIPLCFFVPLSKTSCLNLCKSSFELPVLPHWCDLPSYKHPPLAYRNFTGVLKPSSNRPLTLLFTIELAALSALVIVAVAIDYIHKITSGHFDYSIVSTEINLGRPHMFKSYRSHGTLFSLISSVFGSSPHTSPSDLGLYLISFGGHYCKYSFEFQVQLPTAVIQESGSSSFCLLMLYSSLIYAAVIKYSDQRQLRGRRVCSAYNSEL